MKRLVTVCVRRRTVLDDFLGSGKDGDVFRTSAKTAIKLFSTPEVYRRERDVYFRFRENRVMQVAGFHVPQFVTYHHDLLALEMTVVRPPFALDCASAYLDEAPEFPRM